MPALVASVAAPIADLVELLEDARAMLRRDADPRVDDVDRRRESPRLRAPMSTPPESRVADRVGDEVAEDALEQRRRRCDHDARCRHAQREALRVRLRLQLGPSSARQQRAERDARGRRRHERAGFEAREVEQLFELALQRRRPRAARCRPAAATRPPTRASPAPRRRGRARAAAGAGRGSPRRAAATSRDSPTRRRRAPRGPRATVPFSSSIRSTFS